MNAYIIPKDKYDKYRKQVEKYGLKETKNTMTFFDIYKLILNASIFTKEIFEKNKKEFEEIFINSETLPDFFKLLSNKINRSEKCRFFKDWLEVFINSQISIERTWYFDIYPNIRTH